MQRRDTGCLGQLSQAAVAAIVELKRDGACSTGHTCFHLFLQSFLYSGCDNSIAKAEDSELFTIQHTTMGAVGVAHMNTGSLGIAKGPRKACKPIKASQTVEAAVPEQDAQ